MGLFIGIGQPTANLGLLNLIRIGRKGERHNLLIPKLLLHFTEINGTLIYTGRCSGLKTIHLNPQLF